jgi:hypothetical protein
MRQDIEFKTEDGVTLRGWHTCRTTRWKATNHVKRTASAVKEMYLFAEAFAHAGLLALFDNRNFEPVTANRVRDRSGATGARLP